jgi:hypothetical protein
MGAKDAVKVKPSGSTIRCITVWKSGMTSKIQKIGGKQQQQMYYLYGVICSVKKN